ncbi:hypothetical protein SY88_12425 [Clostridiales bacterium PH28_bin88]|nr:hypothetical protein SY88_12425 [Clostridiales bacterium PH28_bin88]
MHQSGLVPYRTKSEGVYRILREDILEGRLKPGEKLGMTELAERFGVKIPPIREALKRLEGEGLVQNVPHVGIFVSEISLDELAKILEVRSALEILATKLCAQRAPDSLLKELERIVREMDRVILEDRKRYAQLNRQFHQIICQGSGNSCLAEMVDMLWDRSQRAQVLFRLNSQRPVSSNKEHKEILEALKSRDGEKAAKLASEHKHAAFKSLTESIKAGEDG